MLCPKLKSLLFAGFLLLTLPTLQGCGSDCGGLRGIFKKTLGGDCDASPLVNVTGAASFVASGGSTVQFTALTTYYDGAVVDTTNTVTWSVSNATVGSIDSSGLFTSAASGGITYITATQNGVSDSIELSVVGAVADITVSSAPFGVKLRPNSNEAWVLNSDVANQITVVNMDDNSVITNIDVGAGFSPNHLVFLSDGSKAYLTTAGAPHTIFVIDCDAKTSAAVTTTTSYGVQPAVSPDDAFVYYAQNGGASNVFRIDTSADTSALFDATPACPTGLQIASGGKMYVSDQCHGGNDWIYTYADYTNTTSANFPILGFIANRIDVSPNGARVFATSGVNPETQILDGATDTVIETLPNPGGWAFFNDNTRLVYGESSANYEIFDYTGASLVSIEVLGGFVAPPGGGFGTISDDNTLYLPVGATNTIKVYQYH